MQFLIFKIRKYWHLLLPSWVEHRLLSKWWPRQGKEGLHLKHSFMKQLLLLLDQGNSGSRWCFSAKVYKCTSGKGTGCTNIGCIDTGVSLLENFPQYCTAWQIAFGNPLQSILWHLLCTGFLKLAHTYFEKIWKAKKAVAQKALQQQRQFLLHQRQCSWSSCSIFQSHSSLPVEENFQANQNHDSAIS